MQSVDLTVESIDWIESELKKRMPDPNQWKHIRKALHECRIEAENRTKSEHE